MNYLRASAWFLFILVNIQYSACNLDKPEFPNEVGVWKSDERNGSTYSYSITDRMLLNPITLLYKGSLQNYSALFVPECIKF